nr:iron chelate uptake ABC transporter family permease subunit [Millisia brevis]
MFARPTVVVRLGGAVSGRVTVRSVAVCVGLTAVIVAVGVRTLMSGEVDIPAGDVLRYLVGESGGLDRTIVVNWRLPRVVAAAIFGAALAVSGAVFQTLTRNPLGSPDVIGLSTGAYTGALIVLLVLGSGFGGVALGALVGGVATGLVVYLLSYRSGSRGLRLIIVGIGVSATLTAINQWLILRADIDVAISAAIWGAGTLNGLRWDQAGPAIAIVLPVLVAVLLLTPRLRILDLGDDAAAAVGLTLERTRLVLLVLAVALTAAVTAVTGPIAFVALAAPQLARRLVGSASIPLATSAFMGAALLVIGDLIAGRLFAPIQLPVGVVTVSLGGVYLVWLLFREARS